MAIENGRDDMSSPNHTQSAEARVVKRTGADDDAGAAAGVGSQRASHATRLRGRSHNPLAWLLPLLVAVLAIGAAWWWMERRGMNISRDVVGTSGSTASEGLATLEPGQRVTLRAVEIQSVVGDRTFWIGRGDRRALVVIPEDGAQGSGRETRERFRPGQLVTVSGSVPQSRDVPAGVDGADREAILEAGDRVVVATRVERMAGGSGQ